MRRAIAANHGGNADAAEIFAPNFVSHMGGQPPMNRETFEDTLSGFAGGFPGYTFEIEDQIADGDLVVNRITWRGSSPARFARPFRSETLRLIGVRRIHPTEGSPMATHATGTANLAAFHPVQLTLQLCSQRPGSLRAARPRLAYWERVRPCRRWRRPAGPQPGRACAARGAGRRRRRLDWLATTTPYFSPARALAVPPGRCPPA